MKDIKKLKQPSHFTVSLPKEEALELRHISDALKISIMDIIRDAVTLHLPELRKQLAEEEERRGKEQLTNFVTDNPSINSLIKQLLASLPGMTADKPPQEDENQELEEIRRDFLNCILIKDSSAKLSRAKFRDAVVEAICEKGSRANALVTMLGIPLERMTYSEPYRALMGTLSSMYPQSKTQGDREWKGVRLLTNKVEKHFPPVSQSEKQQLVPPLNKRTPEDVLKDARGDFDYVFDLLLMPSDMKHKVSRADVRRRICELSECESEVKDIVSKYDLHYPSSVGSRALLLYLSSKAKRVSMTAGSRALLCGLKWKYE